VTHHLTAMDATTRTDRDLLQRLLARLHELELCLPSPHERAIHEIAKTAVRDQLSRLSHRLFDLGYTQTPARDDAPRAAS
jgi:hypothetical protein